MREYKRYFLMHWPNSDLKEGFYVQRDTIGKGYNIGYTNEQRTSYSKHTISREAYLLLKKQAIAMERKVKRAAKNYKPSTPYLLLGHHGVGKSYFVKKIAKKMGWKVVDLKMPRRNTKDIKGAINHG